MPTETFYILQISSASFISKLQILVYSIYNYHSQSSLAINNLFRNGQIKEYPLQNGLVHSIPAKDPIQLHIVPKHIQTNPTIMYTNSSHQYSSVHVQNITNIDINIWTVYEYLQLKLNLQVALCCLYLAVVCYILFVLNPLQNDQAHPLPKYNSGGRTFVKSPKCWNQHFEVKTSTKNNPTLLLFCGT